MTTPNVVDVSKYQSKAINGSMDIDFADLKANGIKAVIIQLGHGITQDPAAETFISKAKAAGLIVHGYHFFESGHANQVQFSITNAQQLGLSRNAYYFLDMEGNITGSWADQFRPFYRNWKMNGWNVGLYASLSKYGLFSMDEFKTNHVYKWVADWDVAQAPGIADVWQYNCSTGLGSYTLKLDKDVDIAGNLIQPINKPKPIVTDPNGTFSVQAGAFVNFDYSTTSIQGGKMLVASPDGVNKIPKVFPDGTFGFINKDYDHIWDGIKDRIKLPSVSDKIQWANIINVPDLVTRDDLRKIELTPGPQGQPGTPGKDGKPGTNGKDGVTPHIDSTTGDWFIGSQDTGTKARGPAGRNGRDGVDGQPGKDGHDGQNGSDGKPGVNGKDGQPGKDGKSAYQLAVDHGFVGSESEWLQSLHGKDGTTTSGGDASLSIEAITDLIKQHIHAVVNTTTGQLTISTDDISNGSIADAVAAKVVSSMNWKMTKDGELIAEVGGETS